MKKPTEQLRELWGEIKKGLQEKRYIGNELDEALEVDAAVFHLLSICHQPDLVFTVKMTELKVQSMHTSFYFNDEGIVSLTFRSEEPNISLKHYESVLDVREQLEQNWAAELTDSEKSDENVDVTLSKSKYYSFISAMKMKNIAKASEILMSLGLNQESAHDAASGFMSKDKFVAVTSTTITDQSDEETEMVMFYSGSRSSWIIEVPNDEENALKLSKASMGACFQMITQFMMAKYGSRS